MTQNKAEQPGLEERYFPALDGVRAVAALMVFFDHYMWWTPGIYGVNIFLVLSGFLITGILYDARDTSHRFRNFYVRRSLRIFPVYYAFWIVILILTPLMGIAWNRANWLYIIYLGNYISTIFHSQVASHPEFVELYAKRLPFVAVKHTYPFLILIAHFWSVCTEEQFYLVWPFVVFMVRSRRKLLLICFGTIFVCPLLRLAASCLFPAHRGAIWEFTLLRCDEFLIGGAVALLIRSRYAKVLMSHAITALTIGMFIFVSGEICGAHLKPNIWLRWQLTTQFAAIDAVAVGVILLCVGKGNLLAKGLSWSPLRALGRISYGFYLFHDVPHVFYVAAIWRLRASASGPLRMLPENVCATILAFGSTLVIAAFSFRLIETPFLNLKNRWAPRSFPAKSLPEIESSSFPAKI